MKIFSTKIFALWLTLMLLLMVAPTWAQQAREIKGKVISAEDNGPLVGVAIVIQEHQETGTVTNLKKKVPTTFVGSFLVCLFYCRNGYHPISLRAYNLTADL